MTDAIHNQSVRTEGVRLQNLRDFTVQIRRADDNTIVGTGVAVSLDGKVVTCRHVVVAAGVDPAKADGAPVGVYFPQLRGGNEEKKRQAIVAKYFAEHDDDVVLLQLSDGPSPLAPEQIPVLGTALCSDRHPFRSYGYRKLDKYVAGWADGKIQGCVEAPLDVNVQCEPVQLESSQINSGMSGSAVLDTERNLVVGIVSETWFPDLSTKDRDTAWAVDGRVLSLKPLELPLQDAPQPLKPAPTPHFDRLQAEAAVAPTQKYAWNNAPALLPEWTGRTDLLAQLTHDWHNPATHLAGLIGFGGEGKSSIARQWVEEIRLQVSGLQVEHSNLKPANLQPATPSGVFWWGFYENRSVDEFLEAALTYLGGGKIDPRAVPSSSLRAQIIGAMLGAGRYLFVLDGLEVLQHQEGDGYGLLQSTDLRDLLTFFARPGHASFCLITSRAPLLDLMDYTTYRHHDVDRLSDADGIALLQKLGVHSPLPPGEGPGVRAELLKIVSSWNGHALTLSLVGTYLVKRYQGDARRADEIRFDEEVFVSSAPQQYQHVARILRRYDEHLSEAERALLLLFSAFRTPVRAAAFGKIFRTPSEASQLNRPLTQLSDAEFNALLKRLETYRLLRRDPLDKSYTAHPLIRNYYYAHLTRGTGALDTGVRDTHNKIKDYYLSLAGDTPTYPTLDDLKPLIEVVHHACADGSYDEAFNNIYWERIAQRDRCVMVHQLGAYETDLALITEFFPEGNLEEEPQVTDRNDKRWIISAIGFRLMSLGRLREAVPFYERATKGYLDAQEWSFASATYQNLANLHASLGALTASAEAADQALALARQAENKQDECWSLAWQAWAAHLQGGLPAAAAAFAQAEALEQEIDSGKRYLYSNRGIFHAEHLRRSGEAETARRVTRANLEICERNHWAFLVSQCHRVLGDLDADPTTGPGQAPGERDSALAHYDQALHITRGISHRKSLIEALLGRGRFWARHPDLAGRGDLLGLEDLTGLNDLNEALNYALEGGYRIYEADIRVGLAWAHLTLTPSPSPTGRGELARREAERARQMSVEMGYYWGQVDAEEVLAEIERRR
jgi:tetratricopeptide (TPR) repeat protein